MSIKNKGTIIPGDEEWQRKEIKHHLGNKHHLDNKHLPVDKHPPDFRHLLASKGHLSNKHPPPDNKHLQSSLTSLKTGIAASGKMRQRQLES
jgi:hypothetical protein